MRVTSKSLTARYTHKTVYVAAGIEARRAIPGGYRNTPRKQSRRLIQAGTYKGRFRRTPGSR